MADLVSPRERRIRAAVTRYGRVGESPDDILMQRWTLYGKGDRAHVEGYHRDFDEVMRRVREKQPKRKCKVCGDVIDLSNGTGNANLRYCSEACRVSVRRPQVVRTGPPVTADERKRIVRMYVEGGLSIIAIALRVKRCQTAVVNALKKEGVVRRRRGRPAA